MNNDKIKLLVAEDDANLGNILKDYLEVKGFSPVLCENGVEALKQFRALPFDMCILDIMMPEMDGITLAKKIREKNQSIPIIFLTAKSTKQDAIEGFQAGADDYISKPFNMEELLMRVQAVLKRTYKNSEEDNLAEYQLGKYHFNTNTQVLKLGAQEIKLTSKETGLLKLLCANMNQVVERTHALNLIWENDSYFNARSMDVYVTKLRKHLKEDPRIELINVHGKGFKLIFNNEPA